MLKPFQGCLSSRCSRASPGAGPVIMDPHPPQGTLIHVSAAGTSPRCSTSFVGYQTRKQQVPRYLHVNPSAPGKKQTTQFLLVSWSSPLLLHHLSASCRCLAYRNISYLQATDAVLTKRQHQPPSVPQLLSSSAPQLARGLDPSPRCHCHHRHRPRRDAASFQCIQRFRRRFPPGAVSPNPVDLEQIGIPSVGFLAAVQHYCCQPHRASSTADLCCHRAPTIRPCPPASGIRRRHFLFTVSTPPPNRVFVARHPSGATRFGEHHASDAPSNTSPT